jgi:hypothetical protein
MPAIARRFQPQDPVDAPASTPAGVIEPAVETPEPEGRDRRGPFRPGRLVTARARRSGALAARFFHLADVTVLVVLVVALADAAAPGALINSPLHAVLPTPSVGSSDWTSTCGSWPV